MILIFLIIIALIIVVVFFITNSFVSVKSVDERYTKGYGYLWLESRKGFEKFYMVGMYYRHLKKSDMDEFDGYANAETNNPYDSFAVAIYRECPIKHLGFLAAGNKKIHDLILTAGGKVEAYGYLSSDSNGDDIIGEVAIKTNLELDTKNPFYNKRILITGKFDITKKDLSQKLRNMGAYICSKLYSHIDMVLVGDKANLDILNEVKELNKKGKNIIITNKGELDKLLNDL